MKGLSRSEIQLINAMKDMQRNWEATAASWNDQARVDFENEFIQELLPSVKGAVNAITEINRLLSQAIQECS